MYSIDELGGTDLTFKLKFFGKNKVEQVENLFLQMKKKGSFKKRKVLEISAKKCYPFFAQCQIEQRNNSGIPELRIFIDNSGRVFCNQNLLRLGGHWKENAAVYLGEKKEFPFLN